MKKAYFFLSTLLLFTPFLVKAEDQTKFQQAIELIKTACASGKSVEITASTEGGLDFEIKNASGSGNLKVTVEQSELNGAVAYSNETIRSEESQKIRVCMQPYTMKILDMIILQGELNRSSNLVFLKDQKVPINTPITILDGQPLLTITQIRELNYEDDVRIIIEIKNRNRQELYVTKKSNPNSSTFVYRDTIYIVKVSHINLEDQVVTISIEKYKDLQ